MGGNSQEGNFQWGNNKGILTVYRLYVLALNSTAQSRHVAGPWDDDLHAIVAVYLNGGGEFLVAEIAGVLVGTGALPNSLTHHISTTQDTLLSVANLLIKHDRQV